jgi:Uma2 family endonuclease
MATAEPQPQRMTAEEFDAAFGESEREDRCTEAGCPDLELVDGVVVEGEMPNRRHQIVLGELYQQIRSWARAKGGGVWMNPDLRLGEHDVREPDLIAWWSRQSVPLDGQMRAVPDLVVEIVSARPRDVRRDREEKLAQYCAFGIPHYWTVEPLHRVVEVYLRLHATTGWEYGRRHLATTGSIEVFKGLTLDLDACWRAADG